MTDKTTDDVYEDRNLLAIAFVSSHPNGWWKHDPNEPEFPIVGAETQFGQVSWHVRSEQLDRFKAVIPRAETRMIDTEYDGYTREEKNDRLKLAITYDS